MENTPFLKKGQALKMFNILCSIKALDIRRCQTYDVRGGAERTVDGLVCGGSSTSFRDKDRVNGDGDDLLVAVCDVLGARGFFGTSAGVWCSHA